MNLLTRNMKILWLLVVLQTALAQSGFGTSYLRNSRLCRQWKCINTRLGLSDSLPTSEELGNVLRRLLPPGQWQDVVDSVLNTCYHDRPRRYSNTCPGQAIMHCAVDQLITNCPESSLRKNDACAPVASVAGFNKMFSQSLYEDIATHSADEHRPDWFLKNYFSSKCCNLPELFNSTTLSECGFATMLEFYNHVHHTQVQRKGVLLSQRRDMPTTPANDGDSLQVVSLNDFQPNPANVEGDTQLLDCCDMPEFIQPSWRQECNFKLNWDDQSRLVITNESPAVSTAAPVTTSTSSPVIKKDVILVPQTCEEETCVFNKLNILSPSGTVDIDAFTKLLDNLTHAQPSWTSAKGRVVTTCLRKPVTEYTALCEINKILACTFDVLTENCPYATKSDPCKHTVTERVCQISSSRYRPKHRREICTLPELVDRNILTECGLHSIGKMEPLTTVIKPKGYRVFSSINKCHDLTPSTSCLMNKMGVLNKYGFMDYFKMNDRIRHFTAQNEWSNLQSVYLNAFSNGPLYTEHCNSAKKLLNVVDSVMMTCPASLRKNTAQCANIFNKIINTPVNNRNASQEYTQQIINHFHHIFFPASSPPKAIRPKHITKLQKTPLYNYGILNNENAPKVTTIDLKPKIVKPPVVLLPVYMRVPQSNLVIRRPFGDGIMRSPNFLQNHIAQAHNSTPSPISTTSVYKSQLSSTTPNYKSLWPSTRSIYPENDKFEMLKPE